MVVRKVVTATVIAQLHMCCKHVTSLAMMLKNLSLQHSLHRCKYAANMCPPWRVQLIAGVLQVASGPCTAWQATLPRLQRIAAWLCQSWNPQARYSFSTAMSSNIVGLSSAHAGKITKLWPHVAMTCEPWATAPTVSIMSAHACSLGFVLVQLHCGEHVSPVLHLVACD